MVEQNTLNRSVLLLGEGNFSYALARLRLHVVKNNQYKLSMVATSFDSEPDLFAKYPESVQILQKMRDLQTRESAKISVKIIHNVDATRISETMAVDELDFSRFDEITFCHPHIGSEDLRRNSALVAHFFDSAK